VIASCLDVEYDCNLTKINLRGALEASFLGTKNLRPCQAEVVQVLFEQQAGKLLLGLGMRDWVLQCCEEASPEATQKVLRRCQRRDPILLKSRLIFNSIPGESAVGSARI
jgi:hypothetical protein